MVTRRTLALACFALLIGSFTTAVARAQIVDVQAGDTAVEVDRDDVQVETLRERQFPRTDRQRLGGGDNMDRQIAQWLIVDQRTVISLARYGLERSQSPQVRELAEAIAGEHEEFARKLVEASSRDSRNLPPNAATDVPRESTEEAVREDRRGRVRELDSNRRPVESRPLGNLGARLDEGVERLADTAERVVDDARVGLGRVAAEADRAVDADRASGRTRGARWMDIHRDIAQKLEDVVHEDLQKRQGYEFEAAFVGMLVASHLQQEATLEVLRSRASGELAVTIEQALASVKQHRERAEQVMGQINPQAAK